MCPMYSPAASGNISQMKSLPNANRDNTTVATTKVAVHTCTAPMYVRYKLHQVVFGRILARLGLISLAPSRASDVPMARINIYDGVGRLSSIDASGDDRWLFCVGCNGKIMYKGDGGTT